MYVTERVSLRFSTKCAILSATSTLSTTVLDALYVILRDVATWTAFLVYDYRITFHQEVRLFWRHRFTAASALFFYIPYSTLVTYDVLGMVAWGRIPDSTGRSVPDA
ncbi:hypothetical protein BD413DRAFT_162580 [Trametes elegans]|nr:hypothetical protein BD413DRAFT_162580 [Trametes elegans]